MLLFQAATYLVAFALIVNAQVQNVHLALTGNPSQIVVSWLTFEPSASVVRFGLHSGDYTEEATGNWTSYSKSSGYNHNVLLDGLSLSTAYFYICGDGENWSDEYHFLTQSPNPVPFKIGVYGDMGIDNSADTIAKITSRVQNGEWDFIWHLGDISYADDHLFFEDTWNEWFSDMNGVLPYIPYMAAVGNHEYSCRKYVQDCYDITKNFTTFKNKFLMPGNLSESGTNLFWSIDYGNIHLISISTECGYPGAPHEGCDEIEWLKQDLAKANANRANVPWIFVGAHRPIYSASEGDYNGNAPTGTELAIQKAFEDLFHENKVNIFFTGHVHLYERQYPTYRNNPTSTSYDHPKATVHIISGAAGNIEGLEIFGADPPTWHAYGYNKDQGYGILTIFNDTHLGWDFHRSSDDALLDSVIISQWKDD